MSVQSRGVVTMAVCTRFALGGLARISEPARRATIRARFGERGHDVVGLSAAQISALCGSAFKITGREGGLLAPSHQPSVASSNRAPRAPSASPKPQAARSAA